jgi:hypothetical protein
MDDVGRSLHSRAGVASKRVSWRARLLLSRSADRPMQLIHPPRARRHVSLAGAHNRNTNLIFFFLLTLPRSDVASCMSAGYDRRINKPRTIFVHLLTTDRRHPSVNYLLGRSAGRALRTSCMHARISAIMYVHWKK